MPRSILLVSISKTSTNERLDNSIARFTELLKDLAENGQATLRNRLAMGRWNQDPLLLVATNSEMETRLGLRAPTNRSAASGSTVRRASSGSVRQALRSWFVPQRIPVSGMSPEKDPAAGTLAPLSDTLLAETSHHQTTSFSLQMTTCWRLRTIATSQVAEPRAPSELKQDWTLRRCDRDNTWRLVVG